MFHIIKYAVNRHSFNACISPIAKGEGWIPKVHKGGWLCYQHSLPFLFFLQVRSTLSLAATICPQNPYLKSDLTKETSKKKDCERHVFFSLFVAAQCSPSWKSLHCHQSNTSWAKLTHFSAINITSLVTHPLMVKSLPCTSRYVGYPICTCL